MRNGTVIKRVAYATLACFSTLAMGSGALAQSALFSPVSSAADAGPGAALVASITAKRTTKAIDLVRINLDALQGNSVAMTLRDADSPVAIKDRTFDRGAGDYTWVGKFQSGGDAILVVKDGEVTGQIQSGTKTFSVQPVGNGVHAIIAVDQAQFPPDHPVVRPTFHPGNDSGGQPTTGGASSDAVAADGVQVDVLIAYTTNAKNAYGASMPALAQLSVDVANVSYTRSNNNVSMRLVGTQEIAYTETTFDNALADVTTGTSAVMLSVRANRDALGADVVSLFINQTDYCGLGWLNSTAANAYTAVYYDCAASNFSFAHEVGHNFG